eukprot:243322-Hanusia_phi.AAC.1
MRRELRTGRGEECQRMTEAARRGKGTERSGCATGAELSEGGPRRFSSIASIHFILAFQAGSVHPCAGAEPWLLAASEAGVGARGVRSAASHRGDCEEEEGGGGGSRKNHPSKLHCQPVWRHSRQEEEMEEGFSKRGRDGGGGWQERKGWRSGLAREEGMEEGVSKRGRDGGGG